ncbi:MAG TPA: hypothetical protein VHW23_06290, partial [Kofleriaceae bacterium]|nr:hypothetical protein [Kofleriaceae bacterium]
MVARGILIGALLIACGKSDGTKPAPPAATPVAGSADPSKSPAAAPVEPPPAAAPAAAAPPAAPTDQKQTGSNGPADQPLSVSSKAQADELERAIAPYSEQARKSYPDAKKRFLAGLPAGHKFAVATKLHSPGKVETVFVVVQ